MRLAALTAALAAIALPCLPYAASPAPTHYLTLKMSALHVPGGRPATGTVTLNNPAPAGDVVVTVTSDKPEATVPTSITIAAGQTTGTFRVDTTPVQADVTATVTVSAGAPQYVWLGITRPRLAAMHIPAHMHSGQQFSGEVTLDTKAPTPSYTVALRAQPTGSYLTTPLSVTVPAGRTNGEFVGRVGHVPGPRTGQVTGAAGGTILSTSSHLEP